MYFQNGHPTSERTCNGSQYFEKYIKTESIKLWGGLYTKFAC